MRSPETFDAFYAASRDRLLHETYALTGDAAASRTAVRDAFAVAWHHWRKVSRLDDPEAWVRPLAHGRGRRRHSARPWHRDRSLDPEVRATLDALSKLTARQRQLLVLTTLAPLSMTDIGRAVGLPRHDAERELQTATSQFSLHRDVPSTEVRALVEALRNPVASVRWPRATIVRRAGAARRRTHTLVGTTAATLALLASGTLVAAGSDAEPTSLVEETTAAATLREAPAQEPPPSLSEDSLLGSTQVERLAPRLTWKEGRTGDNLEGDGIVVPCQQERFADPQGVGSLVRTFKGTTKVKKRETVRRNGRTRTRTRTVTEVGSRATQLVELSAGTGQAKQAYAVARSWFSGCATPRMQLLSTRKVSGVGDAAAQFTFRGWGRPAGPVSVGVARSGRLVLTTVVRGERRPTDRALTTTMAAAVNRLCGTEGAGSCAGRARSKAVDPFPAGERPGLLEAVDLPPVTNARGPWVGTPVQRPAANYAATRCDRTSFRGKGIRNPLTRTFLFPESKRAEQFGLTQTVATMKQPRARAFVGQVRQRIRQCAEANLGTSVTPLVTQTGPDRDLVAWNLTIEVSDERAVPFLMAILRERGTVSQIGFTPAGSMSMERADFRAVAERALQRLSNLRR